MSKNELYDLMGQVALRLGIELCLVRELDALAEARSSMEMHFSGRKAR